VAAREAVWFNVAMDVNKVPEQTIVASAAVRLVRPVRDSSVEQHVRKQNEKRHRHGSIKKPRRSVGVRRKRFQSKHPFTTVGVMSSSHNNQISFPVPALFGNHGPLSIANRLAVAENSAVVCVVAIVLARPAEPPAPAINPVAKIVARSAVRHPAAPNNAAARAKRFSFYDFCVY
jgi:hypothetical protein